MCRLRESYLPAFVIVIAACTAISAQFDRGALPPKRIHAGERCPVSTGSHKTVPHVPYIFCSDCLWFGGNTAFFAWAYRLRDGDDAVFELGGVPHGKFGYEPKVPWVARSEYSGQIVVRGHQIDGKGTLRFSAAGPKPQKKFVLAAPNHEPGEHWSFWPAGMYIPHAGCYAVQIDTSGGTEFVIFKAEETR